MKNEKNNITRKCIVTSLILPVEKLTRFSFNKTTKELKLDIDKNLKSRGAYFLKNKDNWEILKKRRLLNKTFKYNFTIDIYNDIEKALWGTYEQEKNK
ncbi:YlxR family protein [Mycoplasmopsis synoviae]|uniref:DUF448 domain-containing protein n=3 Tax=Mycoplasmopsis synoviae TaxID=2109 RepID=A0AAX3F0D4_MYCSY|nr:YlxR family protein [Mycoplasmopsis synoviae]AKB11407.1 hypothetical protein VY93_03790 [Mycoplasmopsis synoviae ATCC 25204]MBD5788477.1 hypothetical protein [Mycoplasmopsis synoviae GX11-T]UBX97635.1 DUF448 domain-containing protein [Mycoplasmopsis synoviae]UBX98673.1 DUF448 domain-containing protein [Mycoplasmopsis synoviae]UBX99580.1 DUF448 domain-containing protein [Mycoplasmopsis synoviae]